MARFVIALALALPVSFCRPPLPDVSVSPGIPCTIGAPPLSSADQLADPMARWTLTVVKTGAEVCGWKPPKH